MPLHIVHAAVKTSFEPSGQPFFSCLKINSGNTYLLESEIRSFLPYGLHQLGGLYASSLR